MKVKKVNKEVKETLANELPMPEKNTIEESIFDLERLKKSAEMVSKRFNLDETYRVTKFNDKESSIEVSLENEEFKLAITIKDISVLEQLKEKENVYK